MFYLMYFYKDTYLTQGNNRVPKLGLFYQTWKVAENGIKEEHKYINYLKREDEVKDRIKSDINIQNDNNAQ